MRDKKTYTLYNHRIARRDREKKQSSSGIDKTNANTLSSHLVRDNRNRPENL